MHAVLREALGEGVEIDLVERLVLVEAGEDVGRLAARWVDVRLQALRADLLHHALHRRVDRTDAALRRLDECLELAVPCGGDRRHHPVRADGNHAVPLGEPNRLLAQRAARVRRHRLHDVADEALVLRASGHEAGPFVAAPHHDVRRRLDFGDLVAIDHLAIAGKIEHARAGIAERLPDGEENRIAEPAAGEHDRLVARDLGRRARRAHQHDGLAGLEQGAKVG